MKTIKQIVIGCLLVVGIVFGYNLWMEYCLDDSNPNNYATIGDIPAPEGYIRVKQVLSLRSRTQLRRSQLAITAQLECKSAAFAIVLASLFGSKPAS